MKIILALLISALMFSCNPKTYVYIANENLYGDLSDGLPAKDTTVTTYFENGNVKGIGRLAVTDENLPTSIKVGVWKEFYENGRLRSVGNYKVSSYLNCGVGGPFREYYSYKDGLWKYYDEYSKLIFEATFLPTKHHVNTVCEDGDSMIFGLVKNVPLNSLEKLTPDKIFEIQKVIVEEGNSFLIYTPLNGEVYITFESKLYKNKP